MHQRSKCNNKNKSEHEAGCSEASVNIKSAPALTNHIMLIILLLLTAKFKRKAPKLSIEDKRQFG